MSSLGIFFFYICALNLEPVDLFTNYCARQATVEDEVDESLGEPFVVTGTIWCVTENGTV